MIGGALYQGNSGLVAGPLGVVKVGFNGFDMGKTTSDAMLDVVQNIKDIAYQQDGTMPADKVRTGIIYQLKVTFGEISTGLLAQIMNGFEAITNDPLSDGAVLTRAMYQSQRDNEAAPLRIAKVDQNGVESDLDNDVMNFYVSIANVDGTLINAGADTQRGVAVTFDIYWLQFAGGPWGFEGAFGYYGDPAIPNIPPVVWPDRVGPYILSASVDGLGTTVELTMNEKCADAGALASKVAVIVDGEYVTVSAAVVQVDPDDDKVDLTVVGITAGQSVLVELLAGALEDLETVPNLSGRIVDFAAVNNVV